MVENDSLEDLMKRSTIVFPRTVDSNEAEEMLKYLVNNMDQCLIRYHTVTSKSIGSTNSLRKRSYLKAEDYAAKLNFSITSLTADDMGHASFEFKEKDFCTMTFESVKASMIPGYRLAEHAKGDIALIDKVREGIESYFSTSH